MIQINICCDNIIGKIKPLHGVNNGPLCYGALIDVSNFYKDAGFPYVRLHDPNWPHPREVDIYTIFPDFSKDPKNPKNYEFSRTDAYIKSIIKTGARIVYRLGVSIEHTEKKYFIHPPRDFNKWADICIGIIKHYNNGWAGGFHYGIKHWEIWNEPEGGPPGPPPSKNHMWTGTDKQYFELYKTAVTAIKKFDPKLKVGGFAATMINPVFDLAFFKYCRKNNLPLDFFSWHTYTDKHNKIMNNALYVKKLLTTYGYTATEVHFNEWNYWAGEKGKKIFGAGSEYNNERVFERSKSEEGASFDAGVLIMLLDLPVDIANYYDGQPTSLWSLFNGYGVPQKNYYAFKAFNELYRLKYRVKTEIAGKPEGVFCCGAQGKNSKEIAILLSNFSAKKAGYKISIGGISKKKLNCKQFVLDKTKNLELTETKNFKQNMTVSIKKHSVLLLKIK